MILVVKAIGEPGDGQSLEQSSSVGDPDGDQCLAFQRRSSIEDVGGEITLALKYFLYNFRSLHSRIK